MKLSDLIVKDAIVAELKSTDRDEVIRELVESLAAAKAIDKKDVDAITKAVIDREKRGSTGFGKGVAVPHVKYGHVKKPVATVGRSSVGVDFSSLDQAPVYSVFLLVTPADRPDDHLQAMDRIFRNLQDDRFRRFLRQAESRQDIIDLLDEADQAQASR